MASNILDFSCLSGCCFSVLSTGFLCSHLPFNISIQSFDFKLFQAIGLICDILYSSHLLIQVTSNTNNSKIFIGWIRTPLLGCHHVQRWTHSSPTPFTPFFSHLPSSDVYAISVGVIYNSIFFIPKSNYYQLLTSYLWSLSALYLPFLLGANNLVQTLIIFLLNSCTWSPCFEAFL